METENLTILQSANLFMNVNSPSVQTMFARQNRAS